MAQAAPAPASGAPKATGRQQRRMRNFLLDAPFQLKYASYLVATTLLFSTALGILLWRTSLEVIDKSHHSVELGQELVRHGRRVLAESKKVKAVVEMNIVKDPVYADNPALLDAFQSDARAHDASLSEQQAQLEQNAQMLKQQDEGLTRQQRMFGMVLVGVLTLLVAVIGLAAIVVTHRIAGPIYKMKRQLGDLTQGNWRIPSPLRKGDELTHFFDAFNDMVVSLRQRQQDEVARLDAAIEELERAQVSGEKLQSLRGLRDHMQAPLD